MILGRNIAQQCQNLPSNHRILILGEISLVVTKRFISYFTPNSWRDEQSCDWYEAGHPDEEQDEAGEGGHDREEVEQQPRDQESAFIDHDTWNVF